jgi:hypothetical protein
VTYATDIPPSSIGCPIGFLQRLAYSRIKEGETVDLNLVIFIGLPGGLEPRADQLRELVKEKKIDCFELHSREMIHGGQMLPILYPPILDEETKDTDTLPT